MLSSTFLVSLLFGVSPIANPSNFTFHAFFGQMERCCSYSGIIVIILVFFRDYYHEPMAA